jgi:hypothetical protein
LNEVLLPPECFIGNPIAYKKRTEVIIKDQDVKNAQTEGIHV